MDWRKIEQALVEIAKSDGAECDNNFQGDKVCKPIEGEVNLTELAKELAERLK